MCEYVVLAPTKYELVVIIIIDGLHKDDTFL